MSRAGSVLSGAEVRTSNAVVVLAVAGVVALWPRDSAPEPPSSGAPVPQAPRRRRT